MEYTFINSGIRETVSFDGHDIETIYLPLLLQLTKLQLQKNRRILVLLAAPPGAGKSTLADFLQYLSHVTAGITPVTAIGMDGFHHRQDYLLSHMTMRDGREIPMVQIKGAPITFDLPLLTEYIRKLLKEPVCGWPVYDRTLHNPVDNAIQVTGDIVLLEGNYLLLDEEGWRDLKNMADFTIFITADESTLRQRLIKRKISTGVTEETAERFVDFSDMVNVRTCLMNSVKADLTIRN